MISMTRYAVKSKSLTPWVRFIWHFQAGYAGIHSKLLPTDSIDIILNLADKMTYEVKGCKFTAPSFHVNGLRSGYSYIHQTGHICAYGISLNSYGLVPFTHKPVSGIQDRIVDLKHIALPLYQKLQSAVLCDNTHEIICNIETALCSELAGTEEYISQANLIQDFINMDDSLTVQRFCAIRGINIKTFERLVLRCTGYPPKKIRQIKRFQIAANQLVHENPGSLADLAYSNSYSDQSHFIKEFHRFSGKAPRRFLKEKATIKENTKYNYL